MQEGYVSRTTLVAATVWGAVLLLFVSAWLLVAVHHQWALLPLMLAGTGLALSAVAATAQMRVYALRMCSLIRATSRHQGPSDTDRGVHSIR